MSFPTEDLLSPENLAKLRSDRPAPAYFPPPPIRGQFLRGPIPLAWLSAAASLRGKAPLAVALALRFEAGRRGHGRSIRLTNPLAAKFGVSRKAKATALAALERAGLVAAERKPKRAPLVTIVERPTPPNHASSHTSP